MMPSLSKSPDTLEWIGGKEMDSHKKKMIAPIVISVLMILYYIIYFCILISLLESVLKYALGIIPILLSIVMVKVCIERINEIKGGEYDDLSKY